MIDATQIVRCAAVAMACVSSGSSLVLAQDMPKDMPQDMPQEAAFSSTFRNRVLGVFDAQTGAPIEIALVSDIVSGAQAYTSNTGTLALTFLPEGASIIRVQKIGFQPVVQAVEISPRDTIPLTVILTPLPTMATVTKTESTLAFASPKFRAFEERRRAGFGRFMTESQLRKNDHRTLAAVLPSYLNIIVACGKTGMAAGKCYPVSTRQRSKYAILGGACEITTYVDGMMERDGDLQRLQALDFAGVEFYAGPATIPARYNSTGSACGVLLLWTRDR